MQSKLKWITMLCGMVSLIQISFASHISLFIPPGAEETYFLAANNSGQNVLLYYRGQARVLVSRGKTEIQNGYWKMLASADGHFERLENGFYKIVPKSQDYFVSKSGTAFLCEHGKICSFQVKTFVATLPQNATQLDQTLLHKASYRQVVHSENSDICQFDSCRPLEELNLQLKNEIELGAGLQILEYYGTSEDKRYILGKCYIENYAIDDVLITGNYVFRYEISSAETDCTEDTDTVPVSQDLFSMDDLE